MIDTMIDTISDFKPQAVVVDAGTFPTHPIAVEWMDSGRPVVCCDGAANTFISSGRMPWRIVGDGDSLLPDLRERFADIVRRIPDQETNDQTKAIRYLRSHGLTRVAIVGATGRREDHTLGNITLLIDYLAQGIDARIYTDYGVFIPVDGTREFACVPGTQVSVFSFGATDMNSEGLAYPLRTFTQLWQGTLNSAPTGRFAIHARGPYLVYLTYPSIDTK